MLEFSHYVRALSRAETSYAAMPCAENGLGAAQLIIASDLRPYVLKAVTNLRPPPRVAAEQVGLRLARMLGLPALHSEPILLTLDAQQQIPALRGLKVAGEVHLAVEYAGGTDGAVIDLPPTSLGQRCADGPYRTMVGTLAAWLDARPAPHPAYWRGRPPGAPRDDAGAARGQRYRMALVGFSGCLGGGTWRLRPVDPEQAWRGADDRSDTEPGPESRLAAIVAEQIAREMQCLPPEWLSALPPAMLAALPHELERRARQLRIVAPARAREHRFR